VADERYMEQPSGPHVFLDLIHVKLTERKRTNARGRNNSRRPQRRRVVGTSARKLERSLPATTKGGAREGRRGGGWTHNRVSSFRISRRRTKLVRIVT
jgi:hypothetical protein